jgi:hypothetical protein
MLVLQFKRIFSSFLLFSSYSSDLWSGLPHKRESEKISKVLVGFLLIFTHKLVISGNKSHCRWWARNVQEKISYGLHGARRSLRMRCAVSVSSCLDLMADGWFILLALCVAFYRCCCDVVQCEWHGLLLPLLFWSVDNGYGSWPCMERDSFLPGSGLRRRARLDYLLPHFDLKLIRSYKLN